MDPDFPDFLSSAHRLAGKVAIVSGGGTVGGEIVGIGDSIARLFAREGAAVAVVDLVADRAERTAEMIRAVGGDALAIVADVTSTSDCERIAATTIKRYGRIDILVNNVGLSAGAGPLEGVEEDLWDQVCRTNLKSAVFLTKYVVPHMVAVGGGSIINIASIAALRAFGGSAYGPTKAALVALASELAVIYGAQGVRANSIAPGHLFTSFIAHKFSKEQRKRRQDVAPLCKIEGNGWDVAATALFLASDDARFISGVCIPVDGGVTQFQALAAINRKNA